MEFRKNYGFAFLISILFNQTNYHTLPPVNSPIWLICLLHTESKWIAVSQKNCQHIRVTFRGNGKGLSGTLFDCCWVGGQMEGAILPTHSPPILKRHPPSKPHKRRPCDFVSSSFGQLLTTAPQPPFKPPPPPVPLPPYRHHQHQRECRPLVTRMAPVLPSSASRPWLINLPRIGSGLWSPEFAWKIPLSGFPFYASLAATKLNALTFLWRKKRVFRPTNLIAATWYRRLISIAGRQKTRKRKINCGLIVRRYWLNVKGNFQVANNDFCEQE